MVQTMKNSPVPRQRLLSLLGLACYTTGFVAVLLLPLLAKTTYISENALMPGSGNPAFGHLDTLDARASASEVKSLMSQGPGGHRAVARWLVKRMDTLGADCYLHPFFPPNSGTLTSFPTPSQHFKWDMSNQSSTAHLETQKSLGVNLVGIIRAPQAEGNEAIVLVTPFDVENFGEEDALSLGIGLALFARLSNALWIARDIIWLVADAQYGAYPAVAQWLREYHEPTFDHLSRNAKMKADFVKEFLLEDRQTSGDQTPDLTLKDFKRAGTIATGLVFEVKMIPGAAGDSLTLRAEGPNGQMPNLDLINIINSIAVWRENLSVQLESLPRLRHWIWLSYIGEMLKRMSDLARQISPTWDFALPTAVYQSSLATLLSSMFFQVIGLPTGAHGAFRDYQIDAVSLQFPVSDTVSDYLLTKFGRILEGSLRSVNNLLEKWHHSFFLYFLSAPHKYISVGVYMVPFVLLLISLPLTAAALCIPANEEEMATKDLNESPSIIMEKDTLKEGFNLQGSSVVYDSGKWLQALVLVSAVHIWAFFIALIMSLISETNFKAELKIFSWLVIVAVSLWVLLGVHKFFSVDLYPVRSPGKQGQTQLWMAVKALTLGATSIGLAVMSTINYPVALIGALILVPMCLGVFPLQYSWNYAHRPGKSVMVFLPLAAGALLTIFGSPLGLFGLVRIFCGHLWQLTPSSLWYVMESLLTWRSALFPYLLVMHLPCSVLCMYILLSTDSLNLI